MNQKTKGLYNIEKKLSVSMFKKKSKTLRTYVKIHGQPFNGKVPFLIILGNKMSLSKTSHSFYKGTSKLPNEKGQMFKVL